VVGAGTTYYIGNYFEVYVPNSGTTTFNKYYYFGAQRVAAKIAGTLFYFQGDHLGSSSVVMTQSGTSYYSRQTYFPYGAQRTTEGSALPTDYTFTGQKNDDSAGLMFYGARYYDTALGRFTQPDTIVPSPLNPQAFNRYSYGYNNPVRYLDPTGHIPCEDPADCNPGQGGDDQPGDDPNVQPEPPPDYCTVNPYATGCYDPSGLGATDDGKPDDDGTCNLAGCGGKDPSEETYKTPEAKGNPRSGGGRYYAYRPESKPDPSKDYGPGGGGAPRGVKCQLFGWLVRSFCGATPLSTSTGSGLPRSSSQILKSIRSLEQRIQEHELKLQQYIDDPYAFDNQGLLRNAPSEEIRQQIIQGRINHLRTEIDGFREQIDVLRSSLEK
jgi:RHS repeat-associated protein